MNKFKELLEKYSMKITEGIGSVPSLLIHTLFFISIFTLALLGVSFDKIMLVLTTIVSLEAIYLSIFIQLTINRTTAQLHAVEKDIEEISEDIEEIQEDVEEIQEDVEDIQEDVEDIQEDETEEEKKDREDKKLLSNIENQLMTIVREIEELKKK